MRTRSNPLPRLLVPGAAVCFSLGLLACGSADPGTGSTGDPTPEPSNTDGFPKDKLPAEVVPDLPLVAPQSDLDIPVFSGIVDVGPGEDVTFCTFSDVILDEPTIFGESFGAQSPQGHHAIFQYVTTAQEPGTGACSTEDMGPSILLGGTGGKTVRDTPTLPVNFGVEVPAGAQLVMNHHWINTSDETVHGQAMMLARRLERGGDTVLAGNMIMLGLDWEIPAQAPYSYSTQCTFQKDVDYVMALGHMHEYGDNVRVDVTRAEGPTDTIIDREWTADQATGASGQEIYSLDDPMQIHAGDTVKLTCNWNNTTASAIQFPREMCIFFGYTVNENYFCANGTWLDAESAKSASQDVVNNL